MTSEDIVVISCVTFETVKVVEPIKYYGANRAHIIHYVKDDSESNRIYREFYDEVCRQLDDIRNLEVIEHIAKVYDYQAMLGAVVRILNKECDSRVLINISSGTSEYSAAAMIASSMFTNASAFTVGTKEYTVDNEHIRELYSKKGRLIGLTQAVYDPRSAETFNLMAPDMDLVKFLHLMDTMIRKKKSVSATSMVNRLKECNVWTHDPNPNNVKTSMMQKETMYYKRNFLDPVINKGWLKKDPSRNTYHITKDGEIILATFGSVLSEISL